MMAKGNYIIVGENIHCTRIRMTSGKFVETDSAGRSYLLFKDSGKADRLPLPEAFTSSDDWQAGKVRHVDAAIHQGMKGSPEERAAGERYIQAMAKEQEAAGAWFLDLNVDEFSMDPAEKLRAVVWLAGVVQGASGLPLSIDSSNPDILKAGLGACDRRRGQPLVNSVSLERASTIAAAAGARVVASAAGATALPETVAERLANVAELMPMLERHGFARGDIYLDPLVLPVSVNGANGAAVLDTIAALREAYGPEIHFAPGLSNVSFGLPKRALVNQVFTFLCRWRGCDGGIADPLQINDRTLDALDPASASFRLAEDLLLGRDEFGMDYIAASRAGTL